MLIETERKKQKDGVQILTGNIGSSKTVNKETVERIREMYGTVKKDKKKKDDKDED